jgi:hypothetical protein
MKFQSWKRKDKIKRSLPLVGQILTLAQYSSRSWPTFPLELRRTSPGCLPPPHTALTLPCGPARQSLPVRTFASGHWMTGGAPGSESSSPFSSVRGSRYRVGSVEIPPHPSHDLVNWSPRPVSARASTGL